MAGRPPRNLDGSSVDPEPEERVEPETLVMEEVLEDDEKPRQEMPRPRILEFSKDRWRRDLQDRTTQATRDYIESLQKIDQKNMKYNMAIEDRMNDLKGKHKAFASMMVLSTIIPLRNGINVASVAQSAGMGVTMWLFSPEFRKQTKTFLREAKIAMKDMSDSRKKNKQEKLQDLAETRSDKDGNLPPSLERRLARIQKKRNDGRVPFNETSAALTLQGLSEAAYKQMREPGTTPEEIEEIKKNNQDLMERFWQDVQADGLEPSQVQYAARHILMSRIKDEPELADKYVELSHGEFEAKDGEWVSRMGERVDGGMFTLRPPMTLEEHEAALTSMMVRQMQHDVDQGTMMDFNDSMVALAAVRHMRENGFDLDAIPGSRGDKLRLAQKGFAAMENDGFTFEEQCDIYIASHYNAARFVIDRNEGLEDQWLKEYKSQAKEEMSEFKHDPKAAYERWRDGEFYPKGFETTDTRYRAPRTYDDARANQELNEAETSPLGPEKDLGLRDRSTDGFQMGGDGYDQDDRNQNDNEQDGKDLDDPQPSM